MGTETSNLIFIKNFYHVEKMGPLRGDGNDKNKFPYSKIDRREDGSPSWGRKLKITLPLFSLSYVEKMGPLRGDGNFYKHYIIIL